MTGALNNIERYTYPKIRKITVEVTRFKIKIV